MSPMNSIDIKMNSRLCNNSASHNNENEHHAPHKLMFLFFILFIGCLFKTMFVRLRVPYTGLIIIVGVIGGILFNIFDKDDTFLSITTSSPDLLVAIFLPTLVFEAAYRTEYHAFMKSLYSILLLSIAGYCISLFSISTFNRYILLSEQWTFLQCLLLGIILSATRPVTLMHQADYGKIKRLSIILESEAVINNGLAILLFHIIKTLVVNDQTWHTMQFLKTTVIAIAGGIGLGAVAGVLEIIGLPYFYDDPISEITITIAIPYMLYWLCEQVYCSGVIAIVVLGLLLSNHKTAISSEAATFMEKFWNMLALIANTIIYLLTALTIAEFIQPDIRTYFQDTAIFFEIGRATINYLVSYLVRLLTLMSLTLCTKLCRNYHLSWKECLLATWGGFKGSICLILALALASEFQPNDARRIDRSLSKFEHQILIHTTIVVFLSSCINSTYSLLLKILDFTTMSQTKHLYMVQCVTSLRVLVDEKIRLLKTNKYLANADWTFIEKNFQIENPHTVKISENDRNEINRRQCSHCHRLLPAECNHEDLVEEARIHILNIQKANFWRQYRDYEISTQAVRILSSLCDFAIDRKSQYIRLDQLKYYYKPRTFDSLWKHLGSFVATVHRCIHDDWQKYQKLPKNKWRLFFFHILNDRRFHLFLVSVILLNVTLASIRSLMNISTEVNLVLLFIQNICVVIYLLEFLAKVYTFGVRVYCRVWIYYRIEFILLVLATMECIFEYYYLLSSRSLSPRLWSIMQMLVIIQLCRLIRAIENLAASLSILLQRIAYHYVTLSLELCQAYIRSEDDVLSKLHRIIDIEQIREEFAQGSRKRQNEMVEELTFIQSDHANVSASVKTSAAMQKLLNYSKNMIHHMITKGLLGENEAHQITEIINKRLHTEIVPPALFFPIPLNFLHVFPWLHDPDVLEFVLSRLQVKSFSLNEYIYKVNDDAQELFFITAGYAETIKHRSKYHDALSVEKFSKQQEKQSYSTDGKSNEYYSTNRSKSDDHLCHQCQDREQKVDSIDRKSLSSDSSLAWSDDEIEKKHALDLNGSHLFDLHLNDSILHSFPKHPSTITYRLLHAPGDIIGHIDLLNGQKRTETCKCITNTLVWYLKSNDLIDLVERFSHLRVLEKIWHYTALQIAEAVLYEYFNTSPCNATEQERIHIYGHLKRAFLIPDSYLIQHEILHSSHELILIQGSLKNVITSIIYTSPCFIQIEFGHCGLRPLNVKETKILVLRSPHHMHNEEFILPKDLPDLFTHMIYDEKLSIFVPRMIVKYEHVEESVKQSDEKESSCPMVKRTLLGRFLESLPTFQRRSAES